MLFAEWLKVHGFPNAEAVAASLKGKDILNTPEVAFELKATAQADLTGAVRQARRNAAEEELPVVIYRPNGYGPERLGDWLFVTGVLEGTQLLADAGYGDFGGHP